jgi:hypothetical protein
MLNDGQDISYVVDRGLTSGIKDAYNRRRVPVGCLSSSQVELGYGEH